MDPVVFQAAATIMAAKVASEPQKFINDTNATTELKTIFLSTYDVLEIASQEIKNRARQQRFPGRPPGA
ncbi:hypothetical protein [Xenophilus sp. Marseille-Q4582]|uniref:hypothetical protein n=1 Tax=Xenophilus sp. Marseille-Q4582 TaxID=2866600 RepID=UPI001CE46FCC|nr:hypothetical protein [Xenophilus sp. Marseille-Q4582]